MTDAATIADRYLALWNEADEGRRRAMLEEGWAAAARYADPLMAAEGHRALARMIDAARSQFPGHAFRLRGEPDGHGSFARFSWTLAPAGAAPIAGGTDVARLDGSGRISEVIGFLDQNFA